MLKTLHKKIKNSDKFGEEVKLNFDKNSKKHKTLIGGILSIFINIMLTWLIVSKTITMVTKDNNQISSYTSAFDVDSGQEVLYNETRMMMYHVIRK
jgi:hypothetical protein